MANGLPPGCSRPLPFRPRGPCGPRWHRFRVASWSNSRDHGTLFRPGPLGLAFGRRAGDRTLG